MQVRNSKYAFEYLVMLISGYTKKKKNQQSATLRKSTYPQTGLPRKLNERTLQRYKPTLQSLTVWLISRVKQNGEFKDLDQHLEEISC